MTLSDVIRTLEAVASRQPSVKMVVENDVFRLNSVAEARYGVFAFTQGQHTANIASGVMTFAFSLFYVDRLKNDRTNEIEVQSVGILTLDNIIRRLDDLGIYTEASYTFQVFNQRFVDECAGVFCNVQLSAAIGSPCPEDFDGLDADVTIY